MELKSEEKLLTLLVTVQPQSRDRTCRPKMNPEQLFTHLIKVVFSNICNISDYHSVEQISVADRGTLLQGLGLGKPW